jgi:hypothetical protein
MRSNVVRPKTKRRNWIPEKDIIDSVRCPYCLAGKRQRCHRHSLRRNGVWRGGPCQPHRDRVALYQRRLRAFAITRFLDELTPAEKSRLRLAGSE